MLKKLLFCLSGLLLITEASEAQKKRTCATMTHLEMLETQYPGTKARLKQLDRNIQISENKQTTKKISGTPIITIPIVVHVVYKTAAQNISQAQIQSQIDALNEDYSRLNADSTNTPTPFRNLAKDTGIRFALAQRDENGDPTTGVTRTQTTKTTFSDDDAVKYASRGGHDAWTRDKYLNLWVCDMGGDILGYAQFPGSGPAGSDGVVIGYDCFGRTGAAAAPFNKGRTATHEVGHWLGLYHIWGDEPACADDDLVNDTPLQKGENYNCPSFPLTSGSGASCVAGSPGAMFMNYMDYVDDNCMNMFTVGQRTRMHNALNIERDTLFVSDSAQPVVVANLDAAIFKIQSPKGFSCDAQISPKVTLKNKGTTTLTSATISYSLDGGAVQTYQWTGSLATFATTTISLPAMAVTAGSHTFTSRTLSPNGQSDNDPANDAQTVNFTTATQTPGTNLPISESFEGTTFPPAGWTLKNSDNDITWEKTSAASKTGSKSIYMNNFDYSFVGEADELILPVVNLASVSAPTLTFQVAYAPYSGNTTFDSLQVFASTDCGVTFTNLYKKFGTGLATRTGTTSAFTPTAAQWRMETVNLSSLASSNSVIIKFRHTTGYSNNLYLDDINLTGSVGIKEELAASVFTLAPNPSTGNVTVSLKKPIKGKTGISVINMLGQEVYTSEISARNNALAFTLKGNAAGVYLVKVKTTENTYTQKLVITE